MSRYLRYASQKHILVTLNLSNMSGWVIRELKKKKVKTENSPREETRGKKEKTLTRARFASTEEQRCLFRQTY